MLQARDADQIKMDSKEKPLVSIGLPVYNEELYIRESLNSLISQDYDNIEILVSDNASTDNTENICTELAQANNNISYHRFETNQGIANNFNYVLENASGQYFMWASGHDIWSPNYISACVNSMQQDNTTVIAFGTSKWIDQSGNPIESRQYGWIDTRGLDIYSRYVVTFWGNMHPILGVINREKLVARKTVRTAGTDMIVLCRLALEGNFMHAVDADWCRREFRNEMSYKEKMERYKSDEFGLVSSKIEKIFPLIRLPFELNKDIFQSDLNLSTKFILTLLLNLMLPFRYIAGKNINNQ